MVYENLNEDHRNSESKDIYSIDDSMLLPLSPLELMTYCAEGLAATILLSASVYEICKSIYNIVSYLN